VIDHAASMQTIGLLMDLAATTVRVLPDDLTLSGWRTVQVWATQPGPDGAQAIVLPQRTRR
jgi:hypothetical protein